MTRQTAVEKLHVDLSDSIQEWIDGICESEAWESLDAIVTDELARLMAKAAMSALEAQVDAGEYIARQGQG